MSQDNVDVVRTMLDAFGEGRFQNALDLIDPDVEWDPATPDGELFRGHRGVVAFMRQWLDTWHDYEFETVEVLDAGGDRVVAVFREQGRGRGGGVPVEQEFAGVYELRDGRVTRWTRHAGKREALAAVARD